MGTQSSWSSADNEATTSPAASMSVCVLSLDIGYCGGYSLYPIRLLVALISNTMSGEHPKCSDSLLRTLRVQICCPRLARRAALVWLSLLQRRSDQTGLCLKVRPAWPARSVIWDCLCRVQWAQTTVTPFCHSGRLAYSAVRLGVGEPYHPMGEASTGRP